MSCILREAVPLDIYHKQAPTAALASLMACLCSQAACFSASTSAWRASCKVREKRMQVLVFQTGDRILRLRSLALTLCIILSDLRCCSSAAYSTLPRPLVLQAHIWKERPSVSTQLSSGVHRTGCDAKSQSLSVEDPRSTDLASDISPSDISGKRAITVACRGRESAKTLSIGRRWATSTLVLAATKPIQLQIQQTAQASALCCIAGSD
jgi:hypothetical protein